MAIPVNITKEHLLAAIKKIDDEGIPKDADSRFHDVIYNGNKYPPKLIVSYANKRDSGKVWFKKWGKRGSADSKFRTKTSILIHLF